MSKEESRSKLEDRFHKISMRNILNEVRLYPCTAKNERVRTVLICLHLYASDAESDF